MGVDKTPQLLQTQQARQPLEPGAKFQVNRCPLIAFSFEILRVGITEYAKKLTAPTNMALPF
jgi:hypothetical protein